MELKNQTVKFMLRWWTFQLGEKIPHQCADAIIRLRAEWLFKKGDFNNIAFNFTNVFRTEYAKWREGN